MLLDSCIEDSLSSTNNDTSEDTETDDPPKRPSIKDMAEIRRHLVKNLKEKKDCKLTKRMSTDAQLLDTTKQEIALKQQAMEKIEEADLKH